MFKPKQYTTTKLDIKSLPFEQLGQDCSADPTNAVALVENFMSAYNVKHSSWIYPQVLAHLGRWVPVRALNSEFFCGRETARYSCRGNNFNAGVYFFCMTSSRGVLKQASAEGRDYCALVPLILSAFKKYQDIPYSKWSRESLKYIVDERLCSSMLAEVLDYTADEIMTFRETGLQVKTGVKAGTIKSASQTYGLNALPKVISRSGVEYTGPGTLNQLSRMIICQTWCAHPKYRSKYMILSHKNWDELPAALIIDDVLPVEVVEVQPKGIPALWD